MGCGLPLQLCPSPAEDPRFSPYSLPEGFRLRDCSSVRLPSMEVLRSAQRWGQEPALDSEQLSPCFPKAPQLKLEILQHLVSFLSSSTLGVAQTPDKSPALPSETSLSPSSGQPGLHWVCWFCFLVELRPFHLPQQKKCNKIRFPEKMKTSFLNPDQSNSGFWPRNHMEAASPNLYACRRHCCLR